MTDPVVDTDLLDDIAGTLTSIDALDAAHAAIVDEVYLT